MGVDLITLECEIDTGTVSEDGTVVLQGVSFEEDFVDGVVVFEELSPFEIIVDPMDRHPAMVPDTRFRS